MTTHCLKACGAVSLSVKLRLIELEFRKPAAFFGDGMCEASAWIVGFCSHGFVTDMPYILPGGNVSIALPVSFDANRIAIASSTACWRFSATYERDES